ncbi:MAG: DUF3990 domain-containing protein [Oscillospiraceae bacterium]|nr:DUF3990 domain-containing protein [Oscillospiraceae bacterium]
MILYHGTDEISARDICCNGIDLSKSRQNVDFGRGFYLTDDESQARKWSERKAFLTGENVAARLIMVDLDFHSATKMAQVKIFQNPDLEWAQFVINNRCGLEYASKISNSDHNRDAKYDIVVGKIADGSVGKIAAMLKRAARPISVAEARFLMKESFPCQYSLHTPKALSLIQAVAITGR